MKRFDDVLNRQKYGILFDGLLALALVIIIGLAVFGLNRALAATPSPTPSSTPSSIGSEQSSACSGSALKGSSASIPAQRNLC